MKLISDIKDTYSIVGLPRSGTTLLAKIMNSIEGVNCLSEPIRSMHSTNLETKKKLSSQEFERIDQSTHNFLKGYHRYIRENSEFKIGGIKETYSPVPTRINREVNKLFNASDFLIFILREPKSTFSGWRQLKWSNGSMKPRYRYNSDMFIKIYEDYISKYHEMKMIKPTFLIKYEDLCENFSSKWLTDIFKGNLEFEGELDILKPMMGVGDSKCEITNSIVEPRTTYSNLDIEECEKIGNALSHKYRNLRGYGYY